MERRNLVFTAEAFARAFSDLVDSNVDGITYETWQRVSHAFTQEMKSANPRFNEKRFYDACMKHF